MASSIAEAAGHMPGMGSSAGFDVREALGLRGTGLSVAPRHVSGSGSSASGSDSGSGSDSSTAHRRRGRGSRRRRRKAAHRHAGLATIEEESGPPPTGSFIGRYWWVIVLAIVLVLLAVAYVVLLQRKKRRTQEADKARAEEARALAIQRGEETDARELAANADPARQAHMQAQAQAQAQHARAQAQAQAQARAHAEAHMRAQLQAQAQAQARADAQAHTAGQAAGQPPAAPAAVDRISLTSVQELGDMDDARRLVDAIDGDADVAAPVSAPAPETGAAPVYSETSVRELVAYTKKLEEQVAAQRTHEEAQTHQGECVVVDDGSESVEEEGSDLEEEQEHGEGDDEDASLVLTEEGASSVAGDSEGEEGDISNTPD